MLGLHEGLLSMGVESWILTGRQVVETRNCVVADADEKKVAYLKELASELIWSNRTPVSNTHFSLDLEEVNIWDHPLLREADIIHLHWVSGIISSSSSAGLSSLGKPVVWTLHDMRPLTGGCHFSAGCIRYNESCGECPQLHTDALNFTKQAILDMSAALESLRPHFVAPSFWMQGNVNTSRVSRNLPSSRIPYGVDTDRFRPGSRKEARRALGLHLNVDYILLASHSMMEKRKGVSEAIEVLKHLRQNPEFAARVDEGTLRLLCCGESTDDFQPEGWSIDRTGYLSLQVMPMVYQSATVMLFTSEEDNLPNVMLEAMACALPIVANSVGGVPDLLGGEFGEDCLFVAGDSKSGAKLLSKLLNDKGRCTELGKLLSERGLERYSLRRQANDYIELYCGMQPSSPQQKQTPLDNKDSIKGKQGRFFDACHSILTLQNELNKSEEKLRSISSEYGIILQNKWVKLGAALGLC